MSGNGAPSRAVVGVAGRHVSTAALGLGQVLLVAYALGAEGNGKYAVALLVPTLVAQLCSLGLASAHIYFVGRGSVSVGIAVKASLVLVLTVAVAGAALALPLAELLASTLLPGLSMGELTVAALVCLPVLLRSFYAAIVEGRQEFGRANRALVLGSAATLLGTFVALEGLERSVRGALLGYAFGQVTSCLMLSRDVMVLSRKSSSGSDKSVDQEFRSTRHYLAGALRYGVRGYLSNLITQANYRADIFLLNLLSNPHTVGVYVLAVQICERLWMLSSAAATVLMPQLSLAHRNSGGENQLTALACRWVTLLTALGALALGLLSPLVFSLAPEYAATPVAISYLLPGVVAVAFARIIATDLAARGLPQLNLRATSLAFVINVAGNLLLVPRLHHVGAAIATSLAYLAMAAVVTYFYLKVSHARASSLWRPAAGDTQRLREYWQGIP